jgi:hypothetical protein
MWPLHLGNNGSAAVPDEHNGAIYPLGAMRPK